MSPYQHLFSANTVLNVFRNLRATTRDQNDLLLTFQYHPDDIRHARGLGKGVRNADSGEERDGRRSRRDRMDRMGGMGGGSGGRSIGFVVPWRSMQSQKRELSEKERELAEALVVLAGEVVFTDLPSSLQSSLAHNPLIQIRHIAAGISRQMSKIELQMADNAPFALGKNLYTGGEIVRKFLSPIQTLFSQRLVPQRMIFELLMELKDLVFLGMVGCDKEVLEWELNGFSSFEDLDEAIVRAVVPLSVAEEEEGKDQFQKRLQSMTKTDEKPPSSTSTSTNDSRSWLLVSSTDSEEEILYHLESLETTATALSHLALPIDDFCAKSTITLRRMMDRRILAEFASSKKRRVGRCAEYARCMKWAGTAWRQGGGCRRGCRNEDEDPEALPCWHSSSRHFDRRGTYMLGGSKEEVSEEVGVSDGALKLRS
ncbi:uncharacterized protein BDR25DRAFT_25712 [Lindgomyces ingoldianus]|uniref:Uncharacterized protein n=1 Tax=Lindgomyces ingoldianus TaxID=673940 RepID=A0ACB6QWQ7_9PLEO|nr:uncharacterized protein BDR25DRAFT_25712 [Lindgomyces ingoldianus]KAF2471315.1 hypothetical protein BDR25DRAFT_25712 [Lindgomyces ingoldianus]